MEIRRREMMGTDQPIGVLDETLNILALEYLAGRRSGKGMYGNVKISFTASEAVTAVKVYDDVECENEVEIEATHGQDVEWMVRFTSSGTYLKPKVYYLKCFDSRGNYSAIKTLQ